MEMIKNTMRENKIIAIPLIPLWLLTEIIETGVYVFNIDKESKPLLTKSFDWLGEY